MKNSEIIKDQITDIVSKIYKDHNSIPAIIIAANQHDGNVMVVPCFKEFDDPDLIQQLFKSLSESQPKPTKL